MSDWGFINEFGKDVAKRTETTTRSFWFAAMTGCVSGAFAEDTKDGFTEEELNSFSDRLKKWLMGHPDDAAKLLACIAGAPTAALLTPTVLTMLGFGPLGVIAGQSYALSSHKISLRLVLKTLGAPAAAAQAAMGPVAAGSAFAILQSAGMGGYGLIIVKMIAAGGAIMGTCCTVAISFLEAVKEEKCNCGDDGKME
ncbi:hypothetical protein DE146DRAFT_632387 [Phaeosphaeria sp. MPI-PUGE-AT-0046c]|nr:hypothetical protein DE146DRAFT_632387 [Phaeosphaeria sp. MPI-PUGE-AT-0046c]